MQNLVKVKTCNDITVYVPEPESITPYPIICLHRFRKPPTHADYLLNYAESRKNNKVIGIY